MFGNSNPFPLSDRFLGFFRSEGYQKDWMKARASATRSFECYDFNVKAIDTTNLWTATGTSTGTTWAVLAEPGGWVRAVTGASVATGGCQLSMPGKYFNGTRGAGFAALIRLSAETEVRLECGFADVLPANNTNVINSLASATFNSVTTGAVAVFDHASGAGTTTGLYCIGSSTTGNKVATTTNRFASGVTMLIGVEVNGRNVTMFAGQPGYVIATAANGTNAADAWLPFIAANTSSGTKNIDIDTIWTWTNGRN